LSRQLDWQSLGIELPKEQSRSSQPPRTGLLADDYRKPLQRAASQAHNALDRYSFRFASVRKPCWDERIPLDSIHPLLKRLKKNSPPRCEKLAARNLP
jgi:hypothetical protein